MDGTCERQARTGTIIPSPSLQNPGRAWPIASGACLRMVWRNHGGNAGYVDASFTSMKPSAGATQLSDDDPALSRRTPFSSSADEPLLLTFPVSQSGTVSSRAAYQTIVAKFHPANLSSAGHLHPATDLETFTAICCFRVQMQNPPR